MSDLRTFQRGYVLCRADHDASAPRHFYKIALPGGIAFYHDLALPVAVNKDGDDYLLFAGFGVDTLKPSYGCAPISSELFRALRVSETAMFDRLDDISGRFVLVYSRGGNGVRILTDAAGLKTCFYSREMVSSHLNLFNGQPSRIAKLKFTRGAPGRATRIADVFSLTPNTLLEWPSMNIVRFWPRANFTDMSADVAYDIIVPKLQVQIQSLATSDREIIISLTAGFDSRATLAITHDKIRAKYFTYRNPGNVYQEADFEIAGEIARRLKLDYSTFDIGPLEREVAPDFYDMLKASSGFNNSPGLALKYWQSFKSPRAVHIASNLSEIGRAFYRNLIKRPGTMTPCDMARASAPALQKEACVVSAFDDFCSATARDKTFNYDQSDLFYWEHRMGRWMAPSLIEADPAFDTHVLFNCRNILVPMLSVPHADRVKSSINRKIISRLLPSIDGLRFNPADRAA